MYLIYEIKTNKLVAFTESKGNLFSFLKIKDGEGFPKYDYHKADQKEVWLNYWGKLKVDGVI